MVKALKFEDTPFVVKGKDKFHRFAEDIMEIINKKIEYSEIIDIPYSPTTSVADLEHKTRIICSDLLWTKYRKRPEKTDFFKFSKPTIDGKTHFYVSFDVNEWERVNSKPAE